MRCCQPSCTARTGHQLGLKTDPHFVHVGVLAFQTHTPFTLCITQ